ncbi:hypothetical protein Glove_212g155 [Diversispora epigaea]|uniref:Uncharacterized protein n=1 Tax=Diversispora epigaea TaxID=1348612 RepID=A0A397IRX5_9GLOM|nr:hypothetical protein Glove_212g155 [Diversispora epigaea]
MWIGIEINAEVWGGKRISKKVWNLLQEYFLKEEIPKLETIRNWISRYASQHRQEAAIVFKK